jgi:hypothetical protein
MALADSTNTFLPKSGEFKVSVPVVDEKKGPAAMEIDPPHAVPPDNKHEKQDENKNPNSKSTPAIRLPFLRTVRPFYMHQWLDVLDTDKKW